MVTVLKHINAEYDAELRSLRQQIFSMGELVRDHLRGAVNALLTRDAELAHKIIDADRAVNQLELAIDEQCIRMLALRQPAASDLRFVAAALKMVTDLERIGDLSVDMATWALVLIESEPLPSVGDLPAMATAVETMLGDAQASFLNHDAARADAVIAADPEIDAWAARLLDEMKAEMRRDPNAVDRGLAMIFFAKHIERVADHVTNLAEMVVYFVRGQDVRHAQS